MSFVTIEDRVDRLEALFGQFLTEMALLNKQAKELDRAAEERSKAAEERSKAAEERQKAAEAAAEERQKAAEERNRVAEAAAEERHKTAEERSKAVEERQKAAEERSRVAEAAAEERHKTAEERNRAAEERFARFQEEMRAFKDEMRQARRELDKKWGDLANKMGTIIEDILAPNLRRLAVEHFRLETILDFMIRRSRRLPGDPPGAESEFDTIVVGPGALILGEAKSSPSLDHADEFAVKVRTFFDFFPEHAGKRLIAVFGSWSIPDRVVDRLTSQGIYAMRMGEDTMELANAAALEGQRS